MGLLIFGAFAVGLRAANLETNMEELWVEGKKRLLSLQYACFIYPATMSDNRIAFYVMYSICMTFEDCAHVIHMVRSVRFYYCY